MQYQPIVQVFGNGPGVQNSIQVESHQRLKKWYLIPPCLTLSIIRYISRVKWSNPAKRVSPSPTPWCCSYWKRSLWVTNFTFIYLVWTIESEKSIIVTIDDGGGQFLSLLFYFWVDFSINSEFVSHLPTTWLARIIIKNYNNQDEDTTLSKSVYINEYDYTEF